MNILIVSQYFWPESFRVNDLAISMRERGHQVTVLTGIPNYPKGTFFSGYSYFKNTRQEYHGINIFRVPLIGRGKKSGVRLATNYFSFVLSGLLMGPWLMRGRQFDAIFVYGLSPILAAIPALFLGWLKKCPVVIHVQDLWPESLEATGYVHNRAILSAVKRVVSFIYRHTDLLLVQSKAFEQSVEPLSGGQPIIYFPNSADGSASVDNQVTLPDIPGLEEGFPVLFAGNVGTAQAVDVIVDAASALKDYPEIRFVVLGQGSRWEWMCNEVKKRGLNNLHLPGRFPVETMPGLMQKASALLVTLSDKPIFSMTIPNKVQAYLSSGRPIIACINGEGARVVTEAEAGLAVSADNAEGLAEAVLKLYYMSAEERQKLGMNGQRYYKEHFDHEKLSDQLVEHLRDLSNSHKNRSVVP